MRRYKEECEALVKAGAIILVRDGFTEGGIPVYVTRKVTGCFGVKRGRDSEWGVRVDRPFEDDVDGVIYNLILGVNVGGKVEAKGLYCDAEICTRHFSNEEREMILSDAMARLKMASRELCTHKMEKFFADASCRNDITKAFISFLKRNSEFQCSPGIVRNMTVRFGRDGKCLFSVDNSVSSKQPSSTTPDSARGRNHIFPGNSGQIAVQIPSMLKSFPIQIQFCQESPEPGNRSLLDWI